MTRINCVPVEELTGKHLVAEYRELPRVFGLVKKAIERGEKPTDKRNPTTYTLGKGHVRFFYPRLGYLVNRYRDLVNEMLDRGYNPQYRYTVLGTDIIDYKEWWGDWTPDDRSIAINRNRIEERLKSSISA